MHTLGANTLIVLIFGFAGQEVVAAITTNAMISNYSKVQESAVDEGLIDYIALDFKASAEKFKNITNSKFYENFIQTLTYLISSNVKFEVRTTVHSALLDESDISQMANTLYELGYKQEYYLQNFLDTGRNFSMLSAQKSQINPQKIISKNPIKLRNFS